MLYLCSRSTRLFFIDHESMLLTFYRLLLFVSMQGNFLVSFGLGWSVTTSSSIFVYPFDTLRRRMMLTSGQPSKYRNAFHAFQEIIRHEGPIALYRGVTANMLSGMAGAGVLAGYDQLHQIAYRYGCGSNHRLRG